MTVAPPGDGSQPAQDAGGAPPSPLVVKDAGQHPRELLARVGIPGPDPRPVIVVSGGADDLQEPELSAVTETLGPAIRAAVTATGAAVVDGGTASGVMALLGAERARDPARMPLLLGVAPAGKVRHAEGQADAGTPLEPHHTHFVLADSSEWGGETPLLAALAAELAHGEPVVMVLAGGGEGALAEVRQATDRHWPLFVIDGTGGLAADIAAVSAGRRQDLVLKRKLDGADVRVVETGDPDALARALTAELLDEPGPRDAVVLKSAWSLFATYDQLASRLAKTFNRFQAAILGFGVAATLIALAHDELASGSVYRDRLQWLVIAAPITVSVLIALASRRDSGTRWVRLRAAAEAAKSEIYHYRTRTGVYSREALRRTSPPADRPSRLAARLTEIEEGLVQTNANTGPLTPYDGPLPPPMYGARAGDDGTSRLGAERYLEIRIADQLGYYRGRVRSLDRVRAAMQLLTLLAGGLGTLLAAVGEQVWIGATTAIAGAALAHLRYVQVDNKIVSYNQTAARLAALQREFHASGGRDPDIETLVTRAEKILANELSGWVRQMTDALAQLQEEQAEAAATVEHDREAKAAERR